MDRLSPQDMAMWHAWKQASDVLTGVIMQDVTAGSGLSGPDFAVATRLVELGDGTLRQNELAVSVGWHRSRLSHQLSRMQQRGLVTRASLANGVVIAITDTGRVAVTRARPLHAAAVRQHLITKIPPDSREQFLALLTSLCADPSAADTAEITT